jgi:hypothetical protein
LQRSFAELERQRLESIADEAIETARKDVSIGHLSIVHNVHFRSWLQFAQDVICLTWLAALIS